jgi:Suppressor of fused protein (SUFU)
MTVSAQVRTYLERELGVSTTIASFPVGGGFGLLEIVRFRNQPFPGASTIVTIGLSDEVLQVAPSTGARSELAWSYLDSAHVSLDEVEQILGAATRVALTRQQGWLPGTVLPFSGPLIEGLEFETLYSSDISYFPQKVRVIDETEPVTFVASLIPIFEIETKLIKDIGWERFEKQLVESGVDVLDLSRNAFDLGAVGP